MKNLAPILIVEDSEDDFEATERILRGKGNLRNPIMRCESGSEAMALVASAQGKLAQDPRDGRQLPWPPVLILLDLNLPGLGGIDVLQSLKAGDQTKKIPVVVLTTSDSYADVGKCYEYGVNSYVVKPASMEKFASTIGRIRDYWLDLSVVPS